MPLVSIPVPVQNVSPAVGVAAGDDDSCLLLADGTVQCWGGPPGNGGSQFHGNPVQVPDVNGAVAVSVGGVACAVLADSTASCWGDNSYGQLGEAAVESSLPVPVKQLTGVTAVAPGMDSTCALAGGAVLCWGSNTYGQLGNGTTLPSRTPVAVSM